MARNNNVDLSRSASLAYIVGVYLSDGWVTHNSTRYRIGLEAADIRYAERFLAAANAIGIPTQAISEVCRPGKYPIYRVVLGSRILYEYLEPLKRTPTTVLGLIRDYPWDFLGAFFDGDGTINHLSNGYRTLIFMGCNGTTLSLIKEVLQDCGFNPRWYTDERDSVVPSSTKVYHSIVYKLVLTRKDEIGQFLRKTHTLKGGDV